MHKGTVCLTFDFDAVSLWVARGMTTPTSISRGEFGVTSVPRILNLLEKRNIKSSWFIPGHTIDTYFDVCQSVVAKGHEVGLHGYMHENCAGLDLDTERQIVNRSYECVQRLTGEAPKGFRSPSWDLSVNTLNILEEHGIVYESSLMNQDYAITYCRYPDIIVPNGAMQFGETSSIVELPVSWSLDDYPYFEYFRASNILMPGLRTADDVFGNWMDDVKYMLKNFDNGVCIVTMHPQVIGRGHRLLGLERWIDELGNMGITFARMDEMSNRFIQGEIFGIFNPEN